MIDNKYSSEYRKTKYDEFGEPILYRKKNKEILDDEYLE